jgi:epidermal growth factor receptor substrate 15
MIGKDINEIINEKLAMEQNISQKEADIKIKTGEIKSLQSELDTLAATLKQLDNQKGEAQKRLNDLKIQVIIAYLFRSIAHF